MYFRFIMFDLISSWDIDLLWKRFLSRILFLYFHSLIYLTHRKNKLIIKFIKNEKHTQKMN